MRFYTTLLAGALVAMAAAQNPFSFTTLPASFSAGQSFNITWSATSPGTISLLLVQANSPGSNDVHTVSTIAGKIANSGSFNWVVDSSIPSGSGYAFEIVSDSNTNIVNYSGQFAINTPTSPSASGSGSASAAASASGSSSLASGSKTATGAVTSSAASSAPSGVTTVSKTGNSTFTFTSTLATTATVTTTGGAGVTTTAASTSKNAGALETARAGMGLLAFVGAAILVL